MEFWEKQRAEKTRAVHLSRIVGYQVSIEKLKEARAVAETECPGDEEFISIIDTQIASFERDITHERRQMVLDYIGARIDDHSF